MTEDKKTKAPEEIVFTTVKGDQTVTHRIVRQEGESAKSWEAKQRRAAELHPETLAKTVQEDGEAANKVIEQTHLPTADEVRPRSAAPSATPSPTAELERVMQADSAASDKVLDQTRLPAPPAPAPAKKASGGLPEVLDMGPQPPPPGPPPLDGGTEASVLPAPAPPALPDPVPAASSAAPGLMSKLTGLPPVAADAVSGGVQAALRQAPGVVADALKAATPSPAAMALKLAIPGLGPAMDMGSVLNSASKLLVDPLLKGGAEAATKGAPPAAAVEAAAVPAPPPPVAVPSRVGGGASVSLSGKVPGQANIPEAGGIPKDMLEAQRAEREALMAQRTADLEQHKKVLALQQENLEKSKAMLAERNAMVEARQVETQKQNEALAQLQAQVLDAGKLKVDPNHYWASKDGGQKVMAVLAGAAFGFAGKGMEYLQRLDSLVEQDVRAQQANIETRRGSLAQAVGIQNNIMANARNQGLDAIAAKDAAYAMHWQAMEQQLANLREGSAPQMQARFDEMAAALSAKSAQANQALRASMEKAAMDKALTAAQIAHMRSQDYSARVAAMTTAQKGRDKKPISPESASKLAQFQQAVEMTAQLAELTAKNFHGPKDVAAAKLGHIPAMAGIKSEDRAEYEALARTLQSVYGQVSGSGVLSVDEAKNLQAYVIPQWGDFQQEPKNRMVADILNKGYQKLHNSLAVDYELGGTEDPEALRKRLAPVIGHRVGEKK